MLAMNIMYTNADQFTTMKMSELLEFVEQKKPHIIAICEVKPKIPRERKELDYVIPDYSLHPVNIDPNIRGVIIIFLFILRLITIQINLTSSLVKYAYSKFDYVEGIQKSDYYQHNREKQC